MQLIIYIVLGLIALIFILVVIAPKNYDVSRKIVINKPLPDVFNYISSIKKQDEWSPWGRKDPEMKKTYTGKDGEIGFISAWVGNKEEVPVSKKSSI